jgi:hypothetical protein
VLQACVRGRQAGIRRGRCTTCSCTTAAHRHAPCCPAPHRYDITELATYFQLRDRYEAVAAGQSNLRQVVDQLPSHVWDLAIGATAGAAAVMVSMPFDCIKTYIQTRGGELATSPGVWGQTRAFMATGVQLVRRAGPGALFVGVVPRLVQQVPSSTICWWSIEACKNALAPWTDTGSADAGTGAGTGAAGAAGAGGPGSGHH